MNEWMKEGRTKFQDDPTSIGLCQTSRHSLSPTLSLLALFLFPFAFLPICISFIYFCVNSPNSLCSSSLLLTLMRLLYSYSLNFSFLSNSWLCFTWLPPSLIPCYPFSSSFLSHFVPLLPTPSPHRPIHFYLSPSLPLTYHPIHLKDILFVTSID